MFSISFIGKPNAGKSSLFKAATLRDIEISSRPFTTIAPNMGVGHTRVKCPHLELGRECAPKKGSCFGGTRFVPLPLKDVAGLIPGAHKGYGLGNKFLDDAAKADAIVVVLDASGSTDKEGNPGESSPIEELRFIEDEFDQWLYGILKNSNNIREALTGIKISPEVIDAVMEKVDPREDLLEFAREVRKRGKIWAVAANKMDLASSRKWFEELKKEVDLVFPVSALVELSLRKAAERGLIKYVPGASSFEIVGSPSEQEKKALEFVQNYLDLFDSTGLQNLIDAVVEKAGLFPVFPVEDKSHWTDSKGNVLPDCFLVPKGTTARDLAFAIHSDIGQRFVKAIDCKNGLSLGAESELKSGDVVKIMVRK